MKKFFVSIPALFLLGCSGVSEVDMKYATELSYCSGISMAMTVVPKVTGAGGVEKASNFVAIARALTNNSDQELKASFQKGYLDFLAEAKATEEKEKNAPKNQYFMDWNHLMMKDNSCRTNIVLTQATLASLDKFSTNELGAYVTDLKTWIPNTAI